MPDRGYYFCGIHNTPVGCCVCKKKPACAIQTQRWSNIVTGFLPTGGPSFSLWSSEKLPRPWSCEGYYIWCMNWLCMRTQCPLYSMPGDLGMLVMFAWSPRENDCSCVRRSIGIFRRSIGNFSQVGFVFFFGFCKNLFEEFCDVIPKTNKN